MAAKGDFLHGKLDETESLLRLENYYRDLAYPCGPPAAQGLFPRHIGSRAYR